MAQRQMLGEEIILFTDNTGVPAPNLVISSHGAYLPRPEIGKENERSGWFRVQAGVELLFYGPHKVALEDPTVDGVLAKTPFEKKVAGELVRNYHLSKFQGRHGAKTETYASIESGIDLNRTQVDSQHQILASLGLDLAIAMDTDARANAIDVLRQALPADRRPMLTTALGARRYEKYDVLIIRNRNIDARSVLGVGVTLREVLAAIPHPYQRIHCAFCRSRFIFSLPFTKGYVAVDGEDWQRRPNGFRRP